ncbi:uncharacterized protein LOC131938809 [Physella acuta]|uniref:uncharacterized protein LOC131938809 n=1 Tax=Physella acuta TaxID=109671 RepID=UPI0027DC0B5A|nr:uncharacterized protein LOC131938809 [Physella acuta]XP_059152987.1 uncharacterized protein LOC131938809 [Physella acuta]XP_059152988.1 uncharacterized protein LOC131938809 [Physella acuta]
MPSEDTFFTKLGEIPVINDGWVTAWNCYSKMKDYNGLTKYALDVAESGVKKAAELSTPVANIYQSQIDRVNTYACNKLEDIEKKYPLITRPTGEVKEACLEYVQPVVGKVKPVVTYAQDVVTNSKRKVNNMKTCSRNLINGARDFSVNTVTQAVSVTLDTQPGRFVTQAVDTALTCADGLVEKYIPEKENGTEESDGSRDNDGAPYEMNKPEQMELMAPSAERVAVHFKVVSNKLRKRMFQRAMQDFQGAKLKTLDAIGKLHNTVDLIDYAKKNFGNAKNKVEDIWSKINETTDQSGEKSVDPLQAKSAEDHIVMLGRSLLSRVKSGITALEKASSEAGQFVKHPITKSREYKDFIYHFSCDVSNMSVNKARESLIYLQKRLQQLIENVESSNWLAMNIDMEKMDLEDEDLSPGETKEELSSVEATDNSDTENNSP